jgi:hypothetical protein
MCKDSDRKDSESNYFPSRLFVSQLLKVLQDMLRMGIFVRFKDNGIVLSVRKCPACSIAHAQQTPCEKILAIPSSNAMHWFGLWAGHGHNS